MKGYNEKLAKQATRFLEPGEPVVAAAKALPRGASGKRALGGVFGVAGVLTAGRANASSDRLLGGTPIPNNLALGVTDRRLLIFKLSEATDKASKMTHSIPFAQLQQVTSDVGRSVGMKAVHIDITLVDNSTVSLEVVRPNTKDGEHCAQALLTASSTTSTLPSETTAPVPPYGAVGVTGDANSNVATIAASPIAAPPSMPAGWYPINDDSTVQCYWDGQNWGVRMRWNGQDWVQE